MKKQKHCYLQEVPDGVVAAGVELQRHWASDGYVPEKSDTETRQNETRDATPCNTGVAQGLEQRQGRGCAYERTRE